MVLLVHAAFSETALAARALATALSLGFARQAESAHAWRSLSQGLCGSDYVLFIKNSTVIVTHSRAGPKLK